MTDKSSKQKSESTEQNTPQQRDPLEIAAQLRTKYEEAQKKYEDAQRSLAPLKLAAEVARDAFKFMMKDIYSNIGAKKKKTPSGNATPLGDVTKKKDARVLLLAALLKDGPMNQSEAAKAIKKTQGNVSRHWHYLLTNGFIKFVSGDSGPATITEDGKAKLTAWQAL